VPLLVLVVDAHRFGMGDLPDVGAERRAEAACSSIIA
jgi:hypothetical protein